MGVVHLAQTPDGNRVALKVLRPHIIGDDEARERLAREVASLRRVRSPRIAEVLDADPWGETPYVATRYVPGLSLHQHVREEGPIEGADLTHFAAGLADALIAVHQVGVLHRDIKPSNVLLEGRSPVLIDFGLARLADDPRLTHTGWLLGTPGYLAPEILYGEDATPASDVHAWAATVVFASTGKPPFGTGPALAIMDRVRRGEHDLSRVPASVLPFVEAGLAPEPGDRPSTGELVAGLRAPTPVAPPRPRREVPDIATMPWVLAERDEQRTATPPTKPLTVPGPLPTPAQPAREPYMQPPPPVAGSLPGEVEALSRPLSSSLAPSTPPRLRCTTTLAKVPSGMRSPLCCGSTSVRSSMLVLPGDGVQERPLILARTAARSGRSSRSASASAAPSRTCRRRAGSATRASSASTAGRSA